MFREQNAKILLGNYFLIGIVYFTDLYFIPLYFQNVRGNSPMLSGVMILPLITGFSIGSSTSGVIISRIGMTNPVIRTGLVLWTSRASGRMSWHKDTHSSLGYLSAYRGDRCGLLLSARLLDHCNDLLNHTPALRSRTHTKGWQMYRTDRHPRQYRKG